MIIDLGFGDGFILGMLTLWIIFEIRTLRNKLKGAKK